MPLPKDRAWFSAKRYGYGWGLPKRWQGWVAFVIFIAAVFPGTSLIKNGPGYFIAYIVGISAVMIALCWWKGEPARWRWGDDDDEQTKA